MNNLVFIIGLHVGVQLAKNRLFAMASGLIISALFARMSFVILSL